MADDLYKILGVTRRATDDDVRRAFRKLAKENHPDLNPNDAGAADRFKRITQANEILSDTEKRRAYDAGEIDAKGDQRRQSWSYPGAGAARPGPGGRARTGQFDESGFGDIFSEVFGQARGPQGGRGFALKGQDLRYTLEIDFAEAISGAKKRVTLPEGGVLDLAVPEGVTEGQVLRLKGKGSAGPGGTEPGDALVEIKIKPHPQFTRDGDDILVEMPITIDEAVLGGKIEVPTVTGRVQVTVPKGTSSGRVLRLKGKGVRSRANGGYGDQRVTLRIVMPETIDESLAYFFTEWRQKHGYDAGRG